MDPRSWKCKDLQNIARQLCLVLGKREETNGGNHQAPGFVGFVHGGTSQQNKGVNGTCVSNHWFADVFGVGTKRIQTKNGCSKTHNSFSMQANCVMDCYGFSVH